MRVLDQGVFHVVLGERRARLPEVLAVGPEDGDLTPRQAGAQDEAVEAVVLDGPAPRADEGVLEDLLDLRGLELAVGPVDEAEVVDPDRGGALGLYLVRALVHHLDAHVLQQRQDARERDLIPQPEQLEPEEVFGLFYGVVEAHPQVVLGFQGLHAQDVGDGGAGYEAGAVARGEGVAVLAEELRALFLAALLHEGLVEVVRPRAGRLDDAAFDLLLVVLRGLSRLRVDDEVDAREHGLREPDVVLHVLAAEGLAGVCPACVPGSGCCTGRAARRRGRRRSARRCHA